MSTEAAVSRLDWIMAAPSVLDKIRYSVRQRVGFVDIYHAEDLAVLIDELLEELVCLREAERAADAAKERA